MKYAKLNKRQKTTETNLLFHFKGILFYMNEYLFINMFIKLHYYRLFNIFHHLSLSAPVSKICYFFTMPTQIYKNDFRDIQDNTEQLLSKDIKIFQMKKYTFVTVITCNEFSEAEVRLEGKLHF